MITIIMIILSNNNNNDDDNDNNNINNMSCDNHTHTPARKSYTNFQLYYFVIQISSTNRLGHGHGYEWHSLIDNSHRLMHFAAATRKSRLILIQILLLQLIIQIINNTYIYIYICIQTYVSIYVYVCVYIYIYILMIIATRKSRLPVGRKGSVPPGVRSIYLSLSLYIYV